MLEGSAEHGDSLGNKGTIHKGEVQWMTAGSGIIHQEMPKPDKEGRMYGFQLWTNLPAKEKMSKPRYRDLRASDMPIVTSPEGSKVKIISGEYLGVKGPVQEIYVQPQFWDVEMPANILQSLPAPGGFTCFIYVYQGEVVVDSRKISNLQLVLFEDGDRIELSSTQSGCRLLFLCGKPLRESISWRGPIVMNTREEIRKAFAELESGTFVKVKG
jgi:quercetin 2,3-dioxygenase